MVDKSYFQNDDALFRAYKISGIGGALAIIAFPFSVSISQMGWFLAIAGWAAHYWLRKRKRVLSENPMPLIFPRGLIFAIAVYIVYLFSLTVHSINSQSPLQRFRTGIMTDTKDVFLLTMALWIIARSYLSTEREQIMNYVRVATWIIVISGFLSIFSEFRLSKYPYHILHGWSAGEGARYQHYLFTLFSGKPYSLKIFLPIGLMNTHLTYAAQLGFVFPVLFFNVIDPWIQKSRSLFSRKSLIDIALLFTAIFVLLLNNGRSAIFGIVVSILIGVYYFIRVRWGNKAFRLLIPIFAGLFLVSALYFSSEKVQRKVDQIILPVVAGESKHTDYQRIFLWQATLAMIQDHPFIGVGPGVFSQEVEQHTLAYSQKKPDLWYYYSIIQRGHAHNDYFHLLATGGPLALLAYIAFIFSLMYNVLKSGKNSVLDRWKWGPMLIFVGGLFQCYFLDDEVLLPFWIFVGLAYRMILDGEKNEIDSAMNIDS